MSNKFSATNPTPLEYFNHYTNKDGPIIRTELGPCWIWTKSKGHSGYGMASFKGMPRRAHRFSWEVNNGRIPAFFQVLHKCDNPPCVNPQHLFLGDPKDNSNDKIAKGRASDMRGNNNPAAKLSEVQITEIRMATKNRGMGRIVAKKFGVSPTCISRIRLWRSWRHVPD